MTSSSTSMSTSGGRGGMNIPMMMMEGGAGGTVTTDVSSAHTDLKAKDGKILDMQTSSGKKTTTKEMVIPIQIQGQPAIKQKPKTPKPRMLPFEFPQMPELSMSMSPLDMGMPSATDMMEQMQIEMQKQMGSMIGGMQMKIAGSQMGSMMEGMGSIGNMGSCQMAKATPSVQPKQSVEQFESQTVETVEDQDIFVPLRHIAKVEKNALSEATAMAKMRDG